MIFRTAFLASALCLGGCSTHGLAEREFDSPAGNCQNSSTSVATALGCLKFLSYKSEALSERPTLVVALHGDAPFTEPGYQYDFATLVARQSLNTVAVGLLRPGYTDPIGMVSDGERGETVGDNYDAPRVAAIAQAIAKLRQEFSASKVVLAGHSGGAAITAILIALHPELVDEAIVVSCPCDINRWRRDQLASTGYDGWKGDLADSSPIDLASQVPHSTKISVIVGRNDTNTKPYLSEMYHRALNEAGRPAEIVYIDGGHEIFLDPVVISAVVDATS